MKKLFIISAVALSGLIYNSADAQIRLNLGIHFGPRPVVYTQAPADYCEPTNYNGNEDYYYLPEVDAYYSVPDQCYYYNDGSQWVSAAFLPGAYHDFDWRTAHRFEVRAPRPFLHDDYYRTRYNGVALNGHWDRGFDRGYANVRRDDHFNNRNSGQRVEQNRGFERVGANEHFAQNMPQRNDRNDHNFHRPGRF